MQSRLRQIAPRVKTTTQFQNSLAQFGVLFFLASIDPQSELQFLRIAENNIDQHFVRAANAAFQDQVFKLFRRNRDVRSNDLCVLRHPANVTEFDPPMHCEPMTSVERGQQFVEFNKLPKLRP